MKWKIGLLFLISIAGLVSCVRSPAAFFVELTSIDYAKYQDYSVCDERQSAYYSVYYGDSTYFITMPVSSDSIMQIQRYKSGLSEYEKDSLIKNRIPFYDDIPLDSEVVEPIEEICLMFRKTWQMAPKSLYLAKIRVDDKGNSLLNICWKIQRKEQTWYNVYISSTNGLQDLKNFYINDYDTESIYEKDYVKIEDCLYYRRVDDKL